MHHKATFDLSLLLTFISCATSKTKQSRNPKCSPSDRAPSCRGARAARAPVRPRAGPPARRSARALSNIKVPTHARDFELHTLSALGEAIKQATGVDFQKNSNSTPEDSTFLDLRAEL